MSSGRFGERKWKLRIQLIGLVPGWLPEATHEALNVPPPAGRVSTSLWPLDIGFILQCHQRITMIQHVSSWINYQHLALHLTCQPTHQLWLSAYTCDSTLAWRSVELVSRVPCVFLLCLSLIRCLFVLRVHSSSAASSLAHSTKICFACSQPANHLFVLFPFASQLQLSAHHYTHSRCQWGAWICLQLIVCFKHPKQLITTQFTFCCHS